MASFEAKIMDRPLPRWWIGEFQGEPVVCVSLPTEIRNEQDVPVRLVNAWLEGTEGISFPSAFAAPPREQVSAFLGARFRPLIATEGMVLAGDVNFLDSKSQIHHAGTVVFEPQPACFAPTMEQSATCIFCSKTIPPEDYYPILYGVAHRKCIWR